MAKYRIVCTTQEPIGESHDRAHIVDVGIGVDPYQAEYRFSLSEVIHRMDKGDIFYTKGIVSNKTALVEKYYCQYCRRWHIRSAADAVSDNNLDNLRRCNWG